MYFVPMHTSLNSQGSGIAFAMILKNLGLLVLLAEKVMKTVVRRENSAFLQSTLNGSA